MSHIPYMPTPAPLPLRTLDDLGQAVRDLRLQQGRRAVQVARQSGRSRDLLYRLESGGDITVSALLDILQAMDCALRIEPAGLPTLDEMRQRFAADDDALD
ncbi:MAG TPA: helix-turn-helix transcriptional regulator [Pseudomonas sp.]|nr:helix-turn-helix transcriptional regulator [Pseudomonas sp.]